MNYVKNSRFYIPETPTVPYGTAGKIDFPGERMKILEKFEITVMELRLEPHDFFEKNDGIRKYFLMISS